MCLYVPVYIELLYYHSTTRYNFVRLKATHKISPLEELVGGDLPPSSSQWLTGMSLTLRDYRRVIKEIPNSVINSFYRTEVFIKLICNLAN